MPIHSHGGGGFHRYWHTGGGGGTTGSSGSTDVPTVTGVDPNELHNALYSKVIPLSTLGLARFGTAGILVGPYKNAGVASFAVSFGFPANVSGVRRVYEVSLDSKVAWELAAGSAHNAQLDASGFVSEPFTCRFYGGTLTQPADPLEIEHFDSEAVAYRPQMMLWFEDLPLGPFDGKVPFVSAKIGDTTGAAIPQNGINLADALTRVAFSPWLEYDASSFATSGVADIVQGMILTEDQTFLDLLRTTARVYRTLDILQSDKLRVVDRGSTTTPDLTLDRDRVSETGAEYSRQPESSLPREFELVTIDPDADYLQLPYKASRPRDPVAVTSSVAKETVTLPVIIGPTTRASLATYAQYQEAAAVKRVNLTTMLYGYELEPGDLCAISALTDGFETSEVFKVVESTHGANFENEIVLEAILKCAIPGEGVAEHITCVNYEDTGGLDSMTFVSAGLGNADANRVSVVGININGVVPGAGITSVTIGGVAATEAVQESFVLTQGFISAIFYAAVPTGTSGNVVIEVSDTFTEISIHVYRLVSSSVTVVDTATNRATATTAMSISIDGVDGGYIIACAGARNGAMLAWTGANPDCEFNNDVQTTGYRGSAYYTPTGAGTVSISVDPDLFDHMVICAASFSL